MATQKARFLLRSGTAALWASVNPVLAAGEPGYETDTGTFKVGDGITAWSALPAYERNRQPVNANLTAEAGLTAAADQISYYTSAGAKALAAFTAAGRALVGAVNATAQRTALGLGNIATTDILDEDSFGTNSATRAPSQKSAKTYIGATITAYVADIINGVTGKPKVQGRSLENVVKGEFSVNDSTFVGRTDLDGVRHLLVNILVNGTTALGTISVRFSNDAGATWGASQTVISGIGETDGIGWFRMAMSNGGYGIRMLMGPAARDAAGILTVPAGCNGVQFSHSSSNKAYYDFFILGGMP